LLPGQIDWSLPAFEAEVAPEFEIFPEALHDLRIDVVDRGSTRDKIIGSFLIAEFKLDPFVAAKVIADPTLPAFRLAANPIAENCTLIGVALFLESLPIFEDTAMTVRCRWSGRDSLNAKVKLGNARYMRKVKARPDAGVARSVYGRNVVVRLSIAIKRKPVTQEWQAIGEVE